MTSKEESTSLSKMLKNNNPQEQLEFLKREEVRTMAKDTAKLREQEAREERERISKIKIEPAKTSKDVPTSGGIEAGPPPLMPHEEKRSMVLPKARTRFEKILIRFVVVGVLIFILINGIAFGYWYFMKKRVVEVFPETEVEEPGVQPPAPELIESEDSSESERPSLVSLFQTLREKEDAQGLTKMLVKDKVSELPFPSQLKEIIQDEFEVFSFVSQDKKRLGFIFQLQNSQGAQEILRQWEPSMEGDLKPLWDIVGQKGGAYVPFFRQTSYQNSIVRFQTFSVKDFGIVHALLDSRLILTSSLESMQAAVDQIMQNKQ